MRVSPSAIIFDYGNVLSQSQPIADVQAMATILRLARPQFSDLYWRFRVEYDAGSLDPITYWKTVAATAARDVTEDQISALIEIDNRSWSHPELVMAHWARDVRTAGLRTAILSNMPAPVRDFVLGCSWLPEFDARTFSCEVGICKPAAEIYTDCLNRLGVKPSEALFLDDREPNMRAAETLGIHAVLFKGPAHAASEMESRFSLPRTLSNLL